MLTAVAAATPRPFTEWQPPTEIIHRTSEGGGGEATNGGRTRLKRSATLTLWAAARRFE